MRASAAPNFYARGKTLSPVLVCLLAILVFGAWLRFTHLDWGQGYQFQPDEKTLIHFVDSPGPLYHNPYQTGHYAYGGLPFYLYRFTGRFIARLLGREAWSDPWHLTLIGRFYAALSSTFVIVLIYWLAKWAHSLVAGLLAATLTAIAVLPIQYAHYGVSDTLMAFFAVLLAITSAGLLQTGRLGYYALTGAVAGLAFSTKANGLLWLVFPAIAHVLLGRQRHQRGIHLVIHHFNFVLVAGAAFMIAVWIASPYYLIEFPSFWKVMRIENAKLISGKVKPSWTWQFIGTAPYLYPLKQLVCWSLGIPLGLLALAGWVYTLWISRKSAKLTLLASGPTAFFAIVGHWNAKFIRYLLPIIPFLCLYAGTLVSDVCQKTHTRRMRQVLFSLTIVVIVLSTAYALAVVQIYRHTDTRIAASQWIVNHIPAGARILHDPEPQIVLPLGSAHDYDLLILDYYTSNRLQDLSYWVESLENREYIVITSRRNYSTLISLSDLYPLAACYYQSLFNGTLGYSLVAQFSSYPRLGAWEIKTDKAEETFQVFDHPRVMIFERTSLKSAPELETALNCTLNSRIAAPRMPVGE